MTPRPDEPTPEEEAAAERAPELDEETAQNIEDQYERGAQIEGEGKPEPS